MGDQNTVAIVIPLYRFPLSADESLSVLHLQHYLGHYPRFIAAPQSLSIADSRLKDSQVIRFADSFFSSTQSYNRLMLSRDFYQSFDKYAYILIYQLDCLVFSDALQQWCDQHWAYVGAPWFPSFGNNSASGLWATGNGGFSLRHVRTFLDVLNSKTLWHPPLKRARLTNQYESFKKHLFLYNTLMFFKAAVHASGYKNNVNYVLNYNQSNEDVFWSFEARRFTSHFRIPDPHSALNFAFEQNPRFCFEQTGRCLPFGCHAWPKYDRSFWEPFLLDR